MSEAYIQHLNAELSRSRAQVRELITEVSGLNDDIREQNKVILSHEQCYARRHETPPPKDGILTFGNRQSVDAILHNLRIGRRIEAIKIYCMMTGLGLRVSKDAVVGK